MKYAFIINNPNVLSNITRASVIDVHKMLEELYYIHNDVKKCWKSGSYLKHVINL